MKKRRTKLTKSFINRMEERWFKKMSKAHGRKFNFIYQEQYGPHIWEYNAHQKYLKQQAIPPLPPHTISFDWSKFWTTGIGDRLSGYEGGDNDHAVFDAMGWVTQEEQLWRFAKLIERGRAKGVHPDVYKRQHCIDSYLWLEMMSREMGVEVLGIRHYSPNPNDYRVQLAFKSDEDAVMFMMKNS